MMDESMFAFEREKKSEDRFGLGELFSCDNNITYNVGDDDYGSISTISASQCRQLESYDATNRMKGLLEFQKEEYQRQKPELDNDTISDGNEHEVTSRQFRDSVVDVRKSVSTGFSQRQESSARSEDMKLKGESLCYSAGSTKTTSTSTITFPPPEPRQRPPHFSSFPPVLEQPDVTTTFGSNRDTGTLEAKDWRQQIQEARAQRARTMDVHEQKQQFLRTHPHHAKYKHLVQREKSEFIQNARQTRQRQGFQHRQPQPQHLDIPRVVLTPSSSSSALSTNSQKHGVACFTKSKNCSKNSLQEVTQNGNGSAQPTSPCTSETQFEKQDVASDCCSLDERVHRFINRTIQELGYPPPNQSTFTNGQDALREKLAPLSSATNLPQGQTCKPSQHEAVSPPTHVRTPNEELKFNENKYEEPLDHSDKDTGAVVQDQEKSLPSESSHQNPRDDTMWKDEILAAKNKAELEVQYLKGRLSLLEREIGFHVEKAAERESDLDQVCAERDALLQQRMAVMVSKGIQTTEELTSHIVVVPVDDEGKSGSVARLSMQDAATQVSSAGEASLLKRSAYDVPQVIQQQVNKSELKQNATQKSIPGENHPMASFSGVQEGTQQHIVPSVVDQEQSQNQVALNDSSVTELEASEEKCLEADETKDLGHVTRGCSCRADACSKRTIESLRRHVESLKLVLEATLSDSASRQCVIASCAEAGALTGRSTGRTGGFDTPVKHEKPDKMKGSFSVDNSSQVDVGCCKPKESKKLVVLQCNADKNGDGHVASGESAAVSDANIPDKGKDENGLRHPSSGNNLLGGRDMTVNNASAVSSSTASVENEGFGLHTKEPDVLRQDLELKSRLEQQLRREYEGRMAALRNNYLNQLKKMRKHQELNDSGMPTESTFSAFGLDSSLCHARNEDDIQYLRNRCYEESYRVKGLSARETVNKNDLQERVHGDCCSDKAISGTPRGREQVAEISPQAVTAVDITQDTQQSEPQLDVLMEETEAFVRSILDVGK